MRMVPRQPPLSVYVPKKSAVHGMSPEWKLLAVVVFVAVASVWGRTPAGALISAGCVISVYVLARIPTALAWQQLLSALPVIALLAAFQAWQYGWVFGIALGVMLLSAVMMASLLTLTTTIGELMESIDRSLSPLARFGLPTNRISLTVSLTVRLIPLQLVTISDALQARQARGASTSLRAFATPVFIRSIRRATGIAEALVARGALDEPRASLSDRSSLPPASNPPSQT